ncbi:hypothetical protein JRI60_42585 [Archangium violaceum]|uniref:hypothetical protein n=1 Tax=Archangium violaceum TaxID=83451 RepID=UPI00194FF831|nr:hypothetical protein [Archangium violaceum]QRN95675.1 hypothetical protein JRI60_42585 [Archangium violaceum]
MKIEPGNKPRVPTPAPKPATPATPAEARKPLPVQDGFDDGSARSGPPAPSRPSASGVAAVGARAPHDMGPPLPLPPAALDRLGEADKARLHELARGSLGTDARTNLGRVVDASGFQHLDAEQQAQALRTFLSAPPSSPTSTGHLTSLLSGAGFQSLSPANKAQALDVFRQTSVDGRKHLVDLSHRTVNGRTALLDTDEDGHTLLSSLHGLATGQLEPSLAAHGIQREDLLCSVMREAASPGQLAAHDALCQRNPAEYVRILRGLTSPSGQVRLRDGDTLRRLPDSIPVHTATQRSSSERLFAAATRHHATDPSTGMDKSLFP